MLHTYDPRSVLIAFGGFPIVGFADGTFLNVVRNNDMWSEVVGASGETARAKSNDKSGLATLTLMQTSPSNDVLSSLALQDENLNTGVRPLLVKDGLGTTTLFSATGYIKKVADAGFAKEVGTREWSIYLVDLTIYVGGNIVTGV
jgi:hypothetical protein